MEKMCASEVRRRRMGKNGQDRARLYYRQEKMIENYRSVYKEVEEKNGWDRI